MSKQRINREYKNIADYLNDRLVGDAEWDAEFGYIMDAIDREDKPVRADSEAVKILNKAAALVGGDRAETHGDAYDNFGNIAILWNAYLTIHAGRPLERDDVCQMMSLLKKARTASGTFNEDDHVDDCGYAALAGMMAGAR